MREASWTQFGYQIVSYGNGLSYNIIRLSDFASCFIQGDDAVTWRDEYDAADESDRLGWFLNHMEGFGFSDDE